MNVFLWVVASALALVFLAVGAAKIAQPKPRLVEAGMGALDEFSPGAIKAIGGLEVLAAFGLVLPAAVGVAPVLVPLAALGLVLLMAGAAVTHMRRKENPSVGVNAVLLVLAAVVAWTRFGPYAF